MNATDVVLAQPSRMRSISRPLLALTLLMTLCVSLALTALQLFQVYQDEVTFARARLDALQVDVAPGLSTNMQLNNQIRVEQLLDLVERTPGVVYLRLQGADGRDVTRGALPSDAIARRVFPLSSGRGVVAGAGTLDVAMDDTDILEALRARALQRVLTLAIGLGAGALVLLLLFRHWVTRHLRAMAVYARDLNLQSLGMPMELDRPAHAVPDEFDEVVASFNRMRQRMLDDLDRRQRYEGELTAHRERLEELVDARTSALQAKQRELRAQRDAMRRLANTDHLTGVASRRYFYECASIAIDRARRDERPMSVLMLDIDHFKRINDQHGHAAGDVVLQAFAKACGQRLRHSDCIGRLGGEEFAVVLSGANETQASAIAADLRETASKLRVDVPDGATLQFTVSIGVAVLGQDDADVDALLRHADDALYQAKRDGRDRFVLHVAA